MLHSRLGVLLIFGWFSLKMSVPLADLNIFRKAMCEAVHAEPLLPLLVVVLNSRLCSGSSLKFCCLSLPAGGTTSCLV